MRPARPYRRLVFASLFGATAAVAQSNTPDTTGPVSPKTHDGFQGRAALGSAYIRIAQEGGDRGFSGLAAVGEVFLGGTLRRHAVSFGGFASVAHAPDATARENTSAYELTVLMVGPYADYYPYREGDGPHLLAQFSFMGVSTRDDAGHEPDPDPAGVAFGVGLGYDLWAADELCLGALGRVSVGSVETFNLFGAGARYGVMESALLFSIAYH